MRLSLVNIMDRVLMELACTRAVARLATQETNARRVIVALLNNGLSVEALLFI